MTGSALLSGLTPATTYIYTTTLSDSFHNTTIFTGSFITAALGILNGGTIIQTGSIQIPTGTGTNQSLSGTTIIVSATGGTLTIGTGTTSIDFPTGWDGIILPPFIVPQGASEAATNSEIQPLVTPLNNASYTYAPNVIETVGVGGFPAPITSSGSPFTISVNLISNQVGQTLTIYSSNDGGTWQNNVPSSSCVVDYNNTCTYQARSLGYFALVHIIQTTRPSSGGGGSSISRDSCPNGDFTMSYYDGHCGTKPTTNTTATGTVVQSNPTLGLNINFGTPKVTGSGENIQQDAVSYVMRIINIAYPKLTNDTQKLLLWKRVVSKMDAYLKDEKISEQQKNLCNAIRSLAIRIQKQIRINAQLTSENKASSSNEENPSAQG